MSSDVTKAFADNLSDLIAESKIQTRTLSKETGVGAGAISKYRNDSAEAGINNAAKLAKYFGVSLDYLVGFSTVRNPSTELQAVCKYTGLSEQAVEALDLGRASLCPFVNHVLSNYFAVIDEIITCLSTAKSCLNISVGKESSINTSVLSVIYDIKKQFGEDAIIGVNGDIPKIPEGTMLLDAKDAKEFYVDKAIRIARNLFEDVVDDISLVQINALE